MLKENSFYSYISKIHTSFRKKELELFVLRIDEYYRGISFILISLGLLAFPEISQHPIIAQTLVIAMLVSLTNILWVGYRTCDDAFELTESCLSPPIVKNGTKFSITIIVFLVAFFMMLIVTDIMHLAAVRALACVLTSCLGVTLLLASRHRRIKKFIQFAKLLTKKEISSSSYFSILKTELEYSSEVAASINEWHKIDITTKQMLNELEAEENKNPHYKLSNTPDTQKGERH